MEVLDTGKTSCSKKNHGSRRLCGGLSGLFFLGAVGAILGLRLHVVIVDSKSFINLGTKSSVIINPETVSNLITRNGVSTYKETSSELSISRSMPVILPANSGCICWTLG